MKYDECEIPPYCGMYVICSIGASLTVESMESYGTLERLQYNPLCFLLYQDLRAAPDEWTDVSRQQLRVRKILELLVISVCSCIGGNLLWRQQSTCGCCGISDIPGHVFVDSNTRTILWWEASAQLDICSFGVSWHVYSLFRLRSCWKSNVKVLHHWDAIYLHDYMRSGHKWLLVFCASSIEVFMARGISILYYIVLEFALMCKQQMIALSVVFVTLMSECEWYFKHVDTWKGTQVMTVSDNDFSVWTDYSTNISFFVWFRLSVATDSNCWW